MSYSRYKYYKYVYTSWTQPTLSSDGTVGGSSFAVALSSLYSNEYVAYKAFDNNSSTFCHTKNETTGCGHIIIYNPNPLLISKITCQNRNDGYHNPKNYELYGSDDNSTWVLIGSYTNTNSTGGATWSQSISTKKAYKYFKFKVLTTVNGNLGSFNLAQLTFTARQASGRVIEGTPSDYDYKVEITKEYILCRKVKKYYKNWVQPKVTSNTSNGTISTTTQHPSHPPYFAFNGSRTGGDKYLSNTTSYGDLTWVTPVAIKIRSCKIYTTQEGEYLNRYPTSISVYGSDDGSSWKLLGSASGYAQPGSGGYIEVACSAEKEYKQTKWVFGANFGGNAGVAIGEIEITAGVSGTKYNYNYYETNAEDYILISPNGTNYILKGK